VWLGGVVFAPFLRLLGSTWRIESEGEDPRASSEPFLAVTWTQGLFGAAYHFRNSAPGSRSAGRGTAIASMRCCSGSDSVLRHADRVRATGRSRCAG